MVILEWSILQLRHFETAKHITYKLILNNIFRIQTYLPSFRSIKKMICHYIVENMILSVFNLRDKVT